MTIKQFILSLLSNHIIVFILFLMLICVIYLYIIFIIHFIHNIRTSYKYNWINWYNAYKSNNIKQANAIINKHNINSLELYDIENNIIAQCKYQLILWICAISYTLALASTWNYFVTWNKLPKDCYFYKGVFFTNPIFSILLVTICSSINAIYLIHTTLKIVKSFYHLDININNIIEASLDILIPFYIAEISLFLSSYYSNNGNRNAYICISLLFITFSTLLIFLGLDSHIKNYTNNIYNRIKIHIQQLCNISTNINENETVVEIPIKNNNATIELPLKFFSLYENTIHK